MPNSPDLLTRALQNPTLREAELGRRRARDGTDRDVLAWIEATFGVRIPAGACCKGHVAPAQALLDALRARNSVVLWIASRGFGGKTFLLALLAAANAILFETDVIILGGSGQQSLRVVEQLHRLWAAGQVPPAWLASAPTFTKTTFAWGNTIQALTASQPAVRGAHPTRLLLDEIDEMKLPILEAAQGQPMDRDGVRAQTVMSSTHQHPDGTVTAMRRRAADLGWPVSEWCYRETLEPHGWLTEDQVVRKQAELSRTMWAVEYELQEPSAEGRAIDPPAVERMFDATLGTHIPAGDLEHSWRGQPGPPAERAWPDPAGAWYCIGVDWAQKRHDTVAVVVRCDTTPLQVVAVYRIQRRPWPEMTERVGALLDEFPGPAVHDATGAGSAIGEFPALEAHRQLQGVTMVGRVRTDLFRNYIGPSNGTRSSVLGSTRSIPSTCTAGKTICSGAGIRPIRSSPWRWPITPSRRAGSPVTTASPSDGWRPGGRGDLLDEPPRPACVEAPLAQRLGPHQRDAAIITPHRLVAQRASAVRERADVHARTSPVRVPAPALVERCSTNRCRHVPSGSTCGRRLRTYATGSIAVPSPPHIPLACRAHQSECGRTPLARGHHKEGPSP